MFSKRIVAFVCVALVTLSSKAFGVIVEQEITPKYVAAHQNEFRVETTVHEGSVQFKVTRFVREGCHCSGEIVIQKRGRVVLSCYVLPSKDKSHVSYVFTVSSEYISESDFFLWESRWIEFATVEPGNGKKVTTKELKGDLRFHFPLRDFAKSANNSH